jgi:hypothetical protein
MPALENAKHEAACLAYLADRERIGWRAYRSVYPNSSQHAAETAFGRLLKKRASWCGSRSCRMRPRTAR